MTYPNIDMIQTGLQLKQYNTQNIQERCNAYYKKLYQLVA